MRRSTHDRTRLMAVVSLAQLGCGLVGLAVAARRRHAYDIPFFTGDPDQVVRDAAWMGTAFSAPAPMLAAQAVLSWLAAARGDERAAQGLQLLGAAMVPGCLMERQIRRRLNPRGWDAVETPVAAIALGLAAAMAALGPWRRPWGPSTDAATRPLR